VEIKIALALLIAALMILPAMAVVRSKLRHRRRSD
jgi:hypothetical protein